jgi:hypothetical protein
MSLRSPYAALFAAALAAATPAHARSVTVENNCEEGPRCLRVYNDITKIEFCLDPGQTYTLDGLEADATYCAWCNADRLPDDCKEWPVQFD